MSFSYGDVCVYCVFFSLQSVYPRHVCLSKQEATSICYLAFPDSNSGCMGDTYFTVRLKQGPGNTTLSKAHAAYNKKCSASLEVQPGYLWGYVYFRQVKDTKLPRGYFQKVRPDKTIVNEKSGFFVFYFKFMHFKTKKIAFKGEGKTCRTAFRLSTIC